MGDESLADKCSINVAYNHIHAGEFTRALILIQKIRKSAMKRSDDIVMNMCKSVKRFTRRVAWAEMYQYRSDRNECPSNPMIFVDRSTTTSKFFNIFPFYEETKSGGVLFSSRFGRKVVKTTTTFDDYQRIRILIK